MANVVEQESTTEVETPPVEKPKSHLSWKERLALMTPEEAAEARKKAAEASRKSKAKRRGMTPEQSSVNRLEAKLARIDTQLAELKDAKTAVATDLKEARKALVAAEKANPTIGMAEVGDTEGYPTEEEYNDGAA